MHHFIDTILNGPARYTQEHNYSPGMTLAVIICVFLLECIAVYLIALLIFKAVQNIRPFIGFVLQSCGVGKKADEKVFLELTFPSDTSKSAFATEQLHIILRGQTKSKSLLEKLAAAKRIHSLELVGTRDDGIRYLMIVDHDEVDYIEHSLRAYLPGLKIRQVTDYLQTVKNTNVGVVELRLTADFVLPLQDHKALAEHDPIAYITAHMTKLAASEITAFQIVATPVLYRTHSRTLRRIKKLQTHIAHGKELTSQLVKQRSAGGYALMLLWYPPMWLITTIMRIITAIFGIFTAMFSKDHPLPGFMQSGKDKKSPDNPYEQEVSKQVKSKLDQHLFEVSMRLLVAAPDAETVQRRLNNLVDSFKPFTSSRQAIGMVKHSRVLAPDRKPLPRFKARQISPHFMSQQTILSSSELSDLYHFPETELTKTEGLLKSRSRELPTPLSIKRSDAQLDVIVGVNQHGGDSQPIGITLQQRQKHTYVMGKTGMGKTTLLTNAIYQDMVSGKGLAVLDPHGDMFQELLSIVPEHRKQDVIVFDPSDRDFPIGLNILDPGIDFTNEDDKSDWITSSVVSVFRKMADDIQWGPRMEHILRNTTLTALQLPKPSLYTMQRLLTDKKYQKEVANNLKDPVLKQFWQKEFALMGSMQLAKASSPLTHRLGHFITTKMSRHILLQETSTLRINDIMNEGKILLVNLSKGDIGEDQSLFFGSILTSFIWMAAYQRTKIPEKQRKDFFLYVDEFQNFATPQFTDIVAEGRKFHISLVLSHQNIAQIENIQLLRLIAGNASSLITLKVSPEDEAFILPYMKPEVIKGDMVNLAPYHFYMKTTADESEDAFSGKTVPLDTSELGDSKESVLAASRKRYATPKAEVESYMEELFDISMKPPKEDKPKDTGKGKMPKIPPKDSSKVHGA